MDGGPTGSWTIQLRGAGGIVNSVVASTLGDLMNAPPPCSVADCCELNDDAALEVCMHFAKRLTRVRASHAIT